MPDRAGATGGEAPVGAVLSGATGKVGTLLRIGQGLIQVELRRIGQRGRSKLLNATAFGTYNRAFRPNRTAFDWLSRDAAEVDLYVADELCGNTFTSGFFGDLIGGLRAVNDKRKVARVRRDLPILLIAGDQDPVGAKGKGVRAVREQYQGAGVVDVTCTLYPGARHEVFNETNRDEVTADVIRWLDAHLPTD